MSKDYFTQTYI